VSESRDELVGFLDATLSVAAYPDYGPMGLQVFGAETVDRVVTAVSSSRALFERAAELQAQLVVVHHGLFWDRDSRVIDDLLRERLRVLFDHHISLAAYHLSLDAHPEYGNNTLIVRALGLEPQSDAFALANDRPIGRIGTAVAPVSAADLLQRVGELIGAPHAAFMHGPNEIRRVAVCSGGGPGYLREAASLGCEALITGDMSEPSEMLSRELGIHFIAAGHYATEVFGVRALAELLNRERDVEAGFVDLPTRA
jgi:dinuclear metal center YbgI/SA1388 family protein